MTRLCGLAAALAICLAAPSGAGAAPAVSQAQLEANKKLVLDFCREVFEAQRIEGLKDYYGPNFIEHNPNFGQGIEGFVDTVKGRWSPKPIKATLNDPPVLTMAEGDLVTMVFRRMRPDPGAPGKTYESWWFDTFRVRGGRLVEHWDGALKPTPNAP